MKKIDPTDIIGQTINRLTPIEYSKKYRIGKTSEKLRYDYFYKCQCVCGNIAYVERRSLMTGHTQSCGCLNKERCAEHCKDAFSSHKQSYTRLYRIWLGIKERCGNPKYHHYKDYGGRGIKLCDEWVNSYETFYEWAMSHGYNESLSIDRIDVNGNYSPDNCKWSTSKEQCNNRRNNVYYTYNNETHTLSEWSRIVGIQTVTLQKRVDRGWDIVKVLTEPVHTECRNKTYVTKGSEYYA